MNHLKASVLPVQSPPGTGKSHTAARMILSLIKDGRKVGITALGHKVIAGLLEKVVAAASLEGITIRIVQKVREGADNTDTNWVKFDKDNDAVLELLRNGFHIAAGTSFMWSRETFSKRLIIYL